MRNRVILSLALAFLMAPLAFAGQDAKATNAADGCFQVGELALAEGQPQLVMVGAGSIGSTNVGQCVKRCEEQRQRGFQSCRDFGFDENDCAAEANRFARACKAFCRGAGGPPGDDDDDDD